MSEALELITPGEILLEEFMRPLARINEIVKGKRAIIADTALRLGKCFGTSAELWLGPQMGNDIRRARRDVWQAIEPRIRPLRAA